jgi:hypothetical protein
MTADGRVILLGGADHFYASGKAHDSIAVLTGLDDGTWDFQEVGTLPEARIGMVVELVTDASGKELIFGWGGREIYTGFSAATSAAWLMDAATYEITWQGDHTVSRSEATSIVMDDGRVLMLGGWDGASAFSNATASVFNPVSVEFEYPYPSAGIGVFAPAMASVGSDGVVVCGGGSPTDGFASIRPVDTCARYLLEGGTAGISALPQPRQAHAMATLGDGRVMVVGGIAVDADTLEHKPAEATTWLLTDGQWEEAGPLNIPRANFELVATADGRMIAIGGVQESAATVPDSSLPVDCPEVFDPALGSNGEWVLSTGCSTAAGSGFPTVASHPLHGIFALQGFDGNMEGGLRYSIISAGPPG